MAEQVFDCSRMVRFHMIDDQIINLLALEHSLQTIQIIIHPAAFDGIYDDYFFVCNHIRIVGYSFRERPVVFENMSSSVIYADPVDVVFDFDSIIHMSLI